MRRSVKVLLFVLYIVALAYACFGHFDNMEQISWSLWGIPSDKLVHFCLFLPFPILSYMVTRERSSKPWHSLALALSIFILGCVLAAGSEIGQGLTGYRSCDPADFRADCLALAVSSLAVLAMDLGKQFRK